MAVRLLGFWGGLPAELEAELGLFELGRSGGRTRVLALDRVARGLAGRVRVVEDREARPEDIAAHYAGQRGPDARAGRFLPVAHGRSLARPVRNQYPGG